MSKHPETSGTGHSAGSADAAPRRLTPAAERALAEAAERRRLRDVAERIQPAEVGGREGPDPARYGDWEKDGIISDF